jgi:glycine/D-amino acid oxidase-like deaminating enzyme
VPGIGEIDSVPGFILAAGFSGHGFGIAPGAGHMVASLVAGAEHLVDAKPYHPNRFQAGAWGRISDF